MTAWGHGDNIDVNVALSEFFIYAGKFITLPIILKVMICKLGKHETGRPGKRSSHQPMAIIPRYSTRVQRLNFVGSTSEVCYPYALWNLQNFGAVSP